MAKQRVKKPVRTPRRAKKQKVGLLKRTGRFLPALLLFASALSLHHTTTARPLLPLQSTAVLSYATSMSNSDLLNATNTQRIASGIASLNLNSQLSAAAQTKANDMIARNYWSHNTPDGQEPWVFISNAGYSYITAGENLAYGFSTGSETVTGWMNSPPHKENLLKSSFKDVGFGFANGDNYVNSGQQTVVVAMYGATSAPALAPQSTATAPTPQTQQTAAKPASISSPVSNPVPENIPATTTPEPVAASENKPAEKTPIPEIVQNEPAKIALDTSTNAPTPANVKNIQIITGANARWSIALLVGSLASVFALWVMKRGRQLHHFVTTGEHYFLRHVHFDLGVAGFLFLGYTLLQTSGIVH